MREQVPFFSVIIVALNPGNALRHTLDSVLQQSFGDFEVLIKDGGSTDGSLEQLPSDSRIRVLQQPDSGIFDAMNQAVAAVRGRFVHFLNCGDTFADAAVLQSAVALIERSPDVSIFYGDIRKPHSRSGYVIYPQRLSQYFLMNYPVCQQAWFVARELLAAFPFSTATRIGGDDIWFKQQVAGRRMSTRKIPAVVAEYCGGGVSERTDLQTESAPLRAAACRAAFAPWERVLYRGIFRLRCGLKSLVYDRLLWRIVRQYRAWKQAR